MTSDEAREFAAWKAEKEARERKRGAYWLSGEGRAEIREIWQGDDSSTVWPLFVEMERLEGLSAELAAALERACDQAEVWAGFAYRTRVPDGTLKNIAEFRELARRARGE